MPHISRSDTINRPCDEVYECWRDLDNLPRVIPELDRVALHGAGISHWVVKGPAGVTQSGCRDHGRPAGTRTNERETA